MNQGIHTYLTGPDFKGLEDFELALMELSALKWKQINGPIGLVANREFLEYLGSNKSWYDRVIELHEPITVNKKLFWAAGKVFAYKQMGINHHFIDLDAVIHEPVPEFPFDMMAAHFDFSPFKRSLIGVDSELNLSGINMAYACFKNQELLDKYTEASFSYMLNPTTPIAPMQGWEHMVYAEQTILGDIIAENKYTVGQFRDDSVPTMYHLWEGKQKIIDGKIDRSSYLSDLKTRIEQCRLHSPHSFIGSTPITRQ